MCTGTEDVFFMFSLSYSKNSILTIGHSVWHKGEIVSALETSYVGRRQHTQYEFTWRTKREALRLASNRCELCYEPFTKQRPFEAHHRIPLTLMRYLPEYCYEYINSLANCEILCHDCHQIKDRKVLRLSARETIFLAQTVFATIGVGIYVD